MRKNDTFVTKQVTTRLTKVLMAIFALAERLPTSATLLHTTHFTTNPDRQSIASDPWYKNMQYKDNYKKILQSESAIPPAWPIPVTRLSNGREVVLTWPTQRRQKHLLLQ